VSEAKKIKKKFIKYVNWQKNWEDKKRKGENIHLSMEEKRRERKRGTFVFFTEMEERRRRGVSIMKLVILVF
jgi:hypothetical protein